MPSEAWILLTTNFDLLGALLAVFTEPMGAWFFVLIFALFEMLLYMKTENITMPAILGLFINGVILGITLTDTSMSYQGISELQTMATVLFALSASAIIYKVYKGR